MTQVLKLFVFIVLVYGLFSCSNKSKLIAKINYDFQGCFGGGKSSILIYQSDTSRIAKLEENGNIILKAKLSSMQIDTLKIFITELKKLDKKSGCTTIANYSVTYRNEVIRKTDGGCDWNGFDKLKDCLFRNPFYLVKAK